MENRGSGPAGSCLPSWAGANVTLAQSVGYGAGEGIFLSPFHLIIPGQKSEYSVYFSEADLSVLMQKDCRWFLYCPPQRSVCPQFSRLKSALTLAGLLLSFECLGHVLYFGEFLLQRFDGGVCSIPFATSLPVRSRLA